MKCWLAVVTVQLLTKSYPYQVKTRVQASSPAVRRVLKGRRLQSVRVDLTNLGPVHVGTKVDSVHQEEARL